MSISVCLFMLVDHFLKTHLISCFALTEMRHRTDSIFRTCIPWHTSQATITYTAMEVGCGRRLSGFGGSRGRAREEVGFSCICLVLLVACSVMRGHFGCRESRIGDTPPSEDKSVGLSPKLIGSLSVVGGLVALAVGSALLKDQIKLFLDTFIALVDDWGALGYVAYIVVYALLELLAVPAIPLTMTAGVIFGILPGTAVVSLSSTLAATGAFLISRYLARDRFAAWANKNPKFAAIDKAIGKDGFRVVALLRLSPLLPLAASNYLYGVTSVDLGSYVAASCLGMLPGTLAYVAAGTYGKEILVGGAEGSIGVQWWQLGLGFGFTAFALWYVASLAKDALAEVEE